jgi:HPt (histidine-containing phosphotransfer) domain-containing protein
MSLDRRDWNPEELRRILALAGPADAAQILQHLTGDLSTSGQALIGGLQTANLDVMQRAAHVLVALCGTAGAQGLHRQADELRHLLEGGIGEAAADMARALAAGTTALIALLHEEFGDSP